MHVYAILLMIWCWGSHIFVPARGQLPYLATQTVSHSFLPSQQQLLVPSHLHVLAMDMYRALHWDYHEVAQVLYESFHVVVSDADDRPRLEPLQPQQLVQHKHHQTANRAAYPSHWHSLMWKYCDGRSQVTWRILLRQVVVLFDQVPASPASSVGYGGQSRGG